MNFKTRELSDLNIDLYVARTNDLPTRIVDETVQVFREETWIPFQPSRNWGDGGPIIEGLSINLVSGYFWTDPWTATLTATPQRMAEEDLPRAQADTPLRAAMRAYLVWWYGEEVPNV